MGTLRLRRLIWVSGLVLCLAALAALGLAERYAPSAIETTFYTPATGAARWEGAWEFSPLGADPSEGGGDRVTIPFTGTAFALRVRRGHYRGYFYVTVDGAPANRLPRDERGAYLVLTSPDYAPQVVTLTVAEGLDDGPHVAVVVAERGWDQWPLVGWEVRRGDPFPFRRWREPVTAAAMLCLAGLAATWQAGPSRTAPRAARRGFAAWLWPAAVLTLFTFYLSPWPALTAAAGLALTGLVLWRLDLGLALVAATAPFYRYPRPLCGKQFALAEILVLLSLLSWGLRQVGGGRWRETLRRCNGLDYGVLLFLLTAVAATAWAAHRHVALRELRVMIVEPALFYLMVRTDESPVWPLIDLFVLGGVLVAVVGLAQYALGVNIITAEAGFRRLRSVYGSPNNAGLYLGRVLAVTLAFALFGAGRRRVAYGLAVPPVGLAILLSFSKGALLLGVPVSLLALGALAGGRWLWAALGTLAAGAVAVIPLLRTPRFASLFDPHRGTTFFRLQLWRAAWDMFRDHPWLGVGPDNFLYLYRSRYIRPAAWQEPDLSHPHDILLDFGCRLGIAGLVAGAWMEAAFWRLALPLRRLPEPNRRALALGLMSSMAGFLAHGLVDASYFVIDLAFAFALTLGLVQRLAADGTDYREE